MPDYFSTNPLTMVYTELWSIVEKRPEITAIIAEGNRIRYDKDRDPHKRNISTADVPEILIAPEGITGNLRSTSSSTEIVVRYGVVTATADFRYTTFLAQVQWIFLALLIDWKNTLGCLKWCDKSFVKGVSLISDDVGFTDADPIQEARRKKGWTGLLRFDAKMVFTTTDISHVLISEL